MNLNLIDASLCCALFSRLALPRLDKVEPADFPDSVRAEERDAVVRGETRFSESFLCFRII